MRISMTTEKKQMFSRRITQANKTQLTVIVYEMLSAYLEDARAAHDAGQTEELVQNIDLARACIGQLRSSLDFQYELAGNLFSLYCYADRELARDMFSLKVDNLDTIEMIFTKLRDAYQQISSQDQSGPLMENIQSVYAGLTYGRTDLNESLVNYDAKRGFLV